MNRWLGFVVACVLWVRADATGATGSTGDYHLQPVSVADGVYVLVGADENFNRGNGGNIVNTGFIVGPAGVIVIDSGPSRRYGEQQLAAIARITPRPVSLVFITHAHPDHFLGNQAYPAESLTALAGTRVSIANNGEALSNNLYRLVGGWMKETQVVVPSMDAAGGDVQVAGRALRLIALAGHTDSDLMIYDVQTRTLFSGDLVFHDRAATTPNADLPRWLAALDDIDRLDFKTLVPGHGPVTHDHAAVAQTRDYLRWLSDTLQDAARRGLDMPEVMNLPLPERFKRLAVVNGEYTRSVSHLYPKIELEVLPAIRSTPAGSH